MKDFIKFIGDNPIFLISGIVVLILIVILVLLIITLSVQVKLERMSKEKETAKQDIPISESEIFEDLNIEAEENISEDISSNTSAVETLETDENDLLTTPE